MRSIAQLVQRHKRAFRFGLVALQVVVVVSTARFVLVSHDDVAQPQLATAILSGSKNDMMSAPLDQLSAADVAVQVSRAANMREATAVANAADSMNASLAVPVESQALVSKPQVIRTDLKTRKDIKSYLTKTGDTLGDLAVRFGVTSDSIRWSNNLSPGDGLTAGKQLIIPPVNGVAYKVASGDTPDSLAAKYRADKDKIVSFNDAEISGLTSGETIVIPDGSIAPPVPASVASSLGSGFAWGGNMPVYGNNGYDYGQCTWWAAIRRQQAGRVLPSNLGNAITWASLAARAGLATGSSPAVGAVIWTDPTTMDSYYRIYGHVGYVEKINEDGSVWVSDMNSSGYLQMNVNSGRGGGWGKTSYRLLSPDKARSHTYIY